MNAWSFERKGDVRLAEPGALSVYRGRLMTEMDHLLQSESITQIHLLANSFGAFAVLHALSKGQLPGLASLTLLAPLIDPYPIISGLPAGLHRENAILVPVEAGNRFIPIHRQNLADLDEWRPVPTNVPTLAIIGSKDEVENPANLSRIE
ncbi:MAG TPA: hypothetical protein PK765_06915 [bacterium]|nr:hypothetical protein [bacterium]